MTVVETLLQRWMFGEAKMAALVSLKPPGCKSLESSSTPLDELELGVVPLGERRPVTA